MFASFVLHVARQVDVYFISIMDGMVHIFLLEQRNGAEALVQKDLKTLFFVTVLCLRSSNWFSELLLSLSFAGPETGLNDPSNTGYSMIL